MPPKIGARGRLPSSVQPQSKEFFNCELENAGNAGISSKKVFLFFASIYKNCLKKNYCPRFAPTVILPEVPKINNQARIIIGSYARMTSSLGKYFLPAIRQKSKRAWGIKWHE